MIHGLIRACYERLDSIDFRRQHCSPDTDCYRSGTVFQREWTLSNFQPDALSNLQSAGLIALHQTDQKLLAPVAADDIGRTDDSPGRLHHMEQYMIAEYMPVPVIDLFEVVHVEK